MKVKNVDLVGILHVLEEYSNKRLPQKISFAITRNMINLGNDAECYSQALNKIFEKYADYVIKDDDGNIRYNDQGIPLVDENHIADYGKEIGELLNIEIDINLYKVDISVFDYEDTDKYDPLSAIDIIKLQSILCNQPDGDVDDEEAE